MKTNITLTDEQIRTARYFATAFIGNQEQFIPDVQEAFDDLEKKLPADVVYGTYKAEAEFWYTLVAEKKDGFIFGFATALELVKHGLTNWEDIEKVVELTRQFED